MVIFVSKKKKEATAAESSEGGSASFYEMGNETPIDIVTEDNKTQTSLWWQASLESGNDGHIEVFEDVPDEEPSDKNNQGNAENNDIWL